MEVHDTTNPKKTTKHGVELKIIKTGSFQMKNEAERDEEKKT